MQCRLKKSRMWAMRIMHEASLYEQNSFVTLTYDEENLPNDHSLDKSHHQLFIRLLRRKKYAPRNLRYYHVGEYGSESGRPHYHSILFNTEFADKVLYSRNALGQPIYTSKTLDKAWGRGLCTIGAVTFESAAYCARYVCEKLYGKRAEEYGSLLPEYSTMSLKPGIGAPWLEKYKTDVYPLDACIINGKKQSVPRYYDTLMKKAEIPSGTRILNSFGDPIFLPDLAKSPTEKIAAKRIRKASKHKDNQTPERLAVIDEITHLRLQRLKRDLK